MNYSQLVADLRHRAQLKGARARATGRLGLIRRGSAVAAVAAAAVLVPLVASSASASAATGFSVHLSPNNTSALMLDIDGASGSPGADLIDWVYNGGANQAFTFEPNGNYYEIVNQYSGLCLDGSGGAGQPITQQYCNGSPTQQWATSLASNTLLAYPIQNAGTGLYMDVNGDSPWEGTDVITWYWNGGANQYFAAYAA
jgi:hypothetical protein